MVLKVKGSPTADHSGIYRRPRLVLRPTRIEDIPAILGKPKAYPSPVRPVGADYSQTRCVGGDGGTAVNTGALDKILEFDDGCVRAQAGVRVGTLVRALEERGLELPLTPEIGNISVGALAVTTLPQASYQEGLAQMASCVTEMKLITPQGKQITVTERDRDLIRVLRSSYGLLGIVHEVSLRVQTLKAVKIDYRVYSLAEFSARLREHRERARRAAISHRAVFRPRDRRAAYARRRCERHALRHLANPQFDDAQRTAGFRLLGRQRAGDPGSAQRGSFRRASRAERDAGARVARRRRVRARMDARLAAGSPGRRATPTACGRFHKPTSRNCSRSMSRFAARTTNSTSIDATSSPARAGSTGTGIPFSARATRATW